MLYLLMCRSTSSPLAVFVFIFTLACLSPQSGAAPKGYPENGTFCLVVHGKKPSFESQVEIQFQGSWLPELRQFQYALKSSLRCPLELWYQHSTDAAAAHRLHPGQPAILEAQDYRIQNIAHHPGTVWQGAILV